MGKKKQVKSEKKGQVIIFQNYLQKRYDISYQEITKLFKDNNTKKLYDIFRLLCKEPPTMYNVQKVKSFADAIGLDTTKLLWVDKPIIIKSPKGELIEENPKSIMANENDKLNKNQICNVLQDLFEYNESTGHQISKSLDILKNDLNKLLKPTSLPERIKETYYKNILELSKIYSNNDWNRLYDIFRLLCKEPSTVFNVQKVRALGDILELNASDLDWKNEPAIGKPVNGLIMAIEHDRENKNQICNIIQMIFNHMKLTNQNYKTVLHYFKQEFPHIFPKKTHKKTKITKIQDYSGTDYYSPYYDNDDSSYEDYRHDRDYMDYDNDIDYEGYNYSDIDSEDYPSDFDE